MPPNDIPSTPNVEMAQLTPRLATDDDLTALLKVLKLEKEAGSKGFYCNQQIITDFHKQHKLTVLSTTNDRTPVAFAIIELEEIVLFEVLNDYRGRGIGSLFAQMIFWSMQQCGARGILLTNVDNSARTFWEKNGFQEVPADRGWDLTHGLTMARTFSRKCRLDVHVKEYKRIKIEFRVNSADMGDFESYGEVLTGEAILSADDNEYQLLNECVCLMNFNKHVKIFLTLDDAPYAPEGIDLKVFCAKNRIAAKNTNFFMLSRFCV